MKCISATPGDLALDFKRNGWCLRLLREKSGFGCMCLEFRGVGVGFVLFHGKGDLGFREGFLMQIH